SPIGRITDLSLLEGIKSYNDASVLSPFLPSFASGCNESSSTWYSRPMADPVLCSERVTKYFTPLLAPGVNLNSNDRSNALYAPVHPFEVFPSNNNFQSLCFSYFVKWLGTKSTTNIPGGNGVSLIFVVF